MVAAAPTQHARYREAPRRRAADPVPHAPRSQHPCRQAAECTAVFLAPVGNQSTLTAHLATGKSQPCLQSSWSMHSNHVYHDLCSTRVKNQVAPASGRRCHPGPAPRRQLHPGSVSTRTTRLACRTHTPHCGTREALHIKLNERQQHAWAPAQRLQVLRCSIYVDAQQHPTLAPQQFRCVDRPATTRCCAAAAPHQCWPVITLKSVTTPSHQPPCSAQYTCT